MASADAAEPAAETEVIQLLNYWYPICFEADLVAERPYAFELFGEPLVMFRDQNRRPVCLQDRCPHRSAPLSIGKMWDGRIQCRYHGWTFDNKGKCVRIPSMTDDKIPERVCVVSYPVSQREGMVWVWPGDPDQASDRGFPSQPKELNADGSAKEGWVTYDQIIDQDYSWVALTENLLDPAHLQFTHETTQGNYIAPTNVLVPEATEMEVFDIEGVKDSFAARIRTNKTLKPQNNIILFEPPYVVRIEIVFGNGWRFHQMHYSVPISKWKTRLIVRSMRDWLKWMPDSIMWRLNPKVLRQDAAVLMSQRLRLEQGASRWNFPVKADALGVRFRKWADAAERSAPWFKSYSGSSFKKGGGVVRVAVDDIEDTERCHDTHDMLSGTDSRSLKTVKQVQTETASLWMP